MATSHRPDLCQTCRNLNLRIDTFINTGWRYPTSLQYETVLDVIDGETEARDKHYVPGEHLIGDIDYSDERLAERLKAPSFENEFDEGGLLMNVWPSKRKYLGELLQVKQRASRCALCRFVVNILDREKACPDTSPQESTGKPFKDADKCEILFEYDGQGSGYLTRDLIQRDETQAYGRYYCHISVGRHFEVDLYPLIKQPDLDWFGGRLYETQIDFQIARRWLRSCDDMHPRCGIQAW